MGQYYEEQNLPHLKYQFEDLFRNLQAFLESKGIDLFETLRTDYYSNFKIRPHGFWTPQIDKKKRKQLLYQIGNDKVFLKKHKLTRHIVEKQAAIDLIEDDKYLLTIFSASETNQPQQLVLEYEV